MSEETSDRDDDLYAMEITDLLNTSFRHLYDWNDSSPTSEVISVLRTLADEQ